MSIQFIDLGYCSYHEALIEQERQIKKASAGGNDTLIFVEHYPVYTIGKNGDRSNILANYPEDVKIYDIDRGGDVTYHGPGQLVGYPIISIKNRNIGISSYIHTLENIIIESLEHFGIRAKIRKKLIGVWVEDEKIAAIGVRVINGVTKHGFAINVNTDLSYFNGIIPCGIENCKVTSIEKILEEQIDLNDVKTIVKQNIQNYL